MVSLAARRLLLFGGGLTSPLALPGLQLWLDAGQSQKTQTEIQTLTPSGTWASGTFTLSLDGAPTGDIASNADGAAVQAALVAAFGAGTFTVSGSAGGPWTVTAAGSKAESVVSLLTADLTNIVGAGHGLTIARTSRGYSTPVDADTVQNWKDLSGNGRHLVQATIASRPRYKINIQNGKPALLFDGSDDFLTLGKVDIRTATCIAVLRTLVTTNQVLLSEGRE